MTDADLSNWLDNLMQNNTFGQDVMPALGNDSFQQCFAPNEQDGFHLRNNGQNGFPNLTCIRTWMSLILSSVRRRNSTHTCLKCCWMTFMNPVA